MSTEELSRSEIRGSRSSYLRTYWPARLRWLRRLALVGLAGLLLTFFAAGVSRVVRMIGLPDIGDPFPRQATRGGPSLGGEDAIALFNQAMQCMERHRDEADFNPSRPGPAGQVPGNWLDLNRDTLDLFRQGADSPVAIRPRDVDRLLEIRGPGRNPDQLTGLAMLMSWKLESGGDVEGAWVWLRAALRSTYHFAGGGRVYLRMASQSTRGPIADGIERWSRHPKVDVTLLRRALDDVLACEKLLPADLDTLEVGDRDLMRELQGPTWTHPQHPVDFTIGNATWSLPKPLGEVWWQVRRFLDSEPERSQRVTRLAFANWRAWAEQPARLRPRPAIRSVARLGPRGASSVDFFTPGAGASPAARRMSPRRLADWFETCDDARLALSNYWSILRTVRYQERAGHSTLVLRLAEQLYLRDRGELPPNSEALVGPYLKSLPDDGTSELDDGTTPTTRPL